MAMQIYYQWYFGYREKKKGCHSCKACHARELFILLQLCWLPWKYSRYKFRKV